MTARDVLSAVKVARYARRRRISVDEAARDLRRVAAGLHDGRRIVAIMCETGASVAEAIRRADGWRP